MVTHRKWVNKLRAERAADKRWAEWERRYKASVITHCPDCGTPIHLDTLEHRCEVEKDSFGNIISGRTYDRRLWGTALGLIHSMSFTFGEHEDPLAIEPWSPEKDARESQE